MNFHICKTWDGAQLDHQNIEICLSSCVEGLQLSVVAPFFDDPPPKGKAGEPFPNLWDYEVVEAFFLNEENMYLEVELSPHGQHLLLMLNGCRKCVKDQLPINYTCNVKEGVWTGSAIIPLAYLPPNVCKFNAYAIHGCEKDRTYEALFPVPKDTFTDPDFHRLEYFQSINLKDIAPSNYGNLYKSEEWGPFLQGK